MLIAQKTAPSGQPLPEHEILQMLAQTLEHQFTNQRLLVLIPDHTRTLPLPFLFRTLVEILGDATQLDFMVALGTHPALSEKKLNQLVGITADQRASRYRNIGLYNHSWDNPEALINIGTFEDDQIKALAGLHWHPSMPKQIAIRINQAVQNYDHILILGPTFPHEVVGFSGGAKYLFPGISGPEMINATHWLGALAGVVNTIGVKDTPIRATIHAAAEKVTTPVTLMALIVEGQAISGLFIGDPITAWRAAADVSAQRHIRWVEKPFQSVLSCPSRMYDELWTAAKAMYKLEPVIAPGGELVIYAPHLDTVSRVHGDFIFQVGYHILDYFLADWHQFQHIPLSVLAHSTHVRGSGSMHSGVETPNVHVSLASQISPEDCARLNLGYYNPAEINIIEWQGQEAEGVLVVPHAGELLYRLK